jgi:hypothetical protein
MGSFLKKFIMQSQKKLDLASQEPPDGSKPGPSASSVVQNLTRAGGLAAAVALAGCDKAPDEFTDPGAREVHVYLHDKMEGMEVQEIIDRLHQPTRKEIYGTGEGRVTSEQVLSRSAGEVLTERFDLKYKDPGFRPEAWIVGKDIIIDESYTTEKGEKDLAHAYLIHPNGEFEELNDEREIEAARPYPQEVEDEFYAKNKDQSIPHIRHHMGEVRTMADVKSAMRAVEGLSISADDIVVPYGKFSKKVVWNAVLRILSERYKVDLPKDAVFMPSQKADTFVVSARSVKTVMRGGLPEQSDIVLTYTFRANGTYTQEESPVQACEDSVEGESAKTRAQALFCEPGEL